MKTYPINTTCKQGKVERVQAQGSGVVVYHVRTPQGTMRVLFADELTNPIPPAHAPTPAPTLAQEPPKRRGRKPFQPAEPKPQQPATLGLSGMLQAVRVRDEALNRRHELVRRRGLQVRAGSQKGSTLYRESIAQETEAMITGNWFDCVEAHAALIVGIKDQAR